MKLIPNRIKPYFKTTHQTKNGEYNLIEGVLTCCSAHDFDVFFDGEVKNSVFFKMCLCPENDRIVIEARCKKCGKIILVFDSSCDGYEQREKKQYIHMPTKPINCKKCKNRGFSVSIKYEYTDIQELEELEKNKVDNAFTWIWITLKCNNCGIRYKNFVDCETT